MDEVHSKAHCVTPRGSRNVVAELVFLLVALNGERGNGGGKLIVAEGLKAGSREEAHGEGKIQRLANLGVAQFGVMESAGFQSERAEPRRREL